MSNFLDKIILCFRVKMAMYYKPIDSILFRTSCANCYDDRIKSLLFNISEQLIDRQQTLGDGFQKVLNENRENLYED